MVEIDLDVHSKNYTRALDALGQFIDGQHHVLPDKLYHFTSVPAAANSILTNREMWASHAYDMNDEFEVRYGSNLVILCLQEQQKRYIKSNVFQLAEFFEMALERANPYTNGFNGMPEPFVVSLCEDGTSPSQWKEYANDGKGFRLDFETSKAAAELWKKRLVLLKVIYDAPTQIKLINTAIQHEVDHILAHLDDPFARAMGLGASVAFYQLLLTYSITFKSKKWSKEREWRLVKGTSPIPDLSPPDTRLRGTETVRFRKIKMSDFESCVRLAGVTPGLMADPEETKIILDLV